MAHFASLDIKCITKDSDNICQTDSGIIECKNGNIYEVSITVLDTIFNIIAKLDYNLDDLPRILCVIYHENTPLLASRHSLLSNKFYKLACIVARYKVKVFD